MDELVKVFHLLDEEYSTRTLGPWLKPQHVLFLNHVEPRPKKHLVEAIQHHH